MSGATALLILCAAAAAAGPQSGPGSATEAALHRRSLAAARVRGAAPVIDGRLDEPAWSEAQVASDFVQRRPQPGALASLRTEARVLYDDQALYVGVRLLDPAPESIVAPYPRRDDETTSDWVFAEFDSRHDRRTAFSFGLNPRAVQVDGVFLNDVDYDSAWNAVWEGAARIGSEGWTAEYRIPFSQLPYAVEGQPAPDGSLPAVFGVNVYRYSPKRGETSNWSPRLPSLAGVVSNFNELQLRVPARRARLELAPYVSASKTGPTGDPFGDGLGSSAGLDLRAGLGSAFTLTAAVHPDFGQVEADPSEVNLSTFETLFSERRPLFVEGAGLFGFDLGLPLTTRGNSLAAEQAFYSRRIGRPPRLSAPHGALRQEVPDGAALLGAAKLTGRTAGGWSLGTLAALSDSQSLRFEDAGGLPDTVKVEPLTGFGVLRVSKDFDAGRSAIGAIGTYVGRYGTTPELAEAAPRRSFAAGVNARHRFSHDEYETAGFLLGATSEGTPSALAAVLHGPGHYTQRPDAPHLGGGRVGRSASGFAAQARLAKIGGEHWRWSLAGHAISPRLELNDAGFQRNADWLVALGSLSYQQDRPGALFRRWTVGSDQLGAGWSFGGERRATVVNLKASADLRNYAGGSLSFDHELKALQTEALRGGPALAMPARDGLALSFYSDTRRVSQLTLDLRGFREPASGSRRLLVAPGLSLRAGDRLALALGPSFDWTTNGWQFVGAPAGRDGPHYVLGRLRQTSVGLTTRVDLAFSPHLTLQLYAQPFASQGRFDEYKEVTAPRAARAADRVRPLLPGQVTHDTPGRLGLDLGAAGVVSLADPGYHVRNLRANVVLRWEYRPGSSLFAVWSQQRERSGGEPFAGLGGELWGALDPRPDNSFLVKLSYWFAPRHGGSARPAEPGGPADSPPSGP